MKSITGSTFIGLAAFALAGALSSPVRAQQLADSPAPVTAPRVRAVVIVPDATVAVAVAPDFAGVDASSVPALRDVPLAAAVRPFLGAPIAVATLDALAQSVRSGLAASGRTLFLVHVPPQEVTGGVIRLVVQPARLDSEIGVEGAKWFSEESYRAAVPLAAGREIDVAALQAGVERLNRNPYRRVVVVAEPGAQAGTTKLVLRAQETRPWQVTAGYNNSGTAVTGEDRITAGFTWGNAFDRGDTLGYSLSANPDFEHSVSHSGNYGTTFRSGRSLAVFGSYGTIESALPAPLTQEGTSWQAGARYGLPLARTAGGWTRSLGLSADFKYSDNNLEFATIPITNNVTHIAQFGATFSLSHQSKPHQAALSASIYASPGGLGDANDDGAFEVSRPGAKAAYVYGRIEGRYARQLPGGISWSIAGSVQLAGGPLLGTEQLNGGGSGAVRGYRESSAFGDTGVLVNTELHLPGFALAKGRDQMDVFAFVDAASLRDHGPAPETTDLASAGVGANYRFGRHFSLRAAYGWRLREIPNLADQGSGRGHLSASVSF